VGRASSPVEWKGHDQGEHDITRAIEPIRTEILIESIERTECKMEAKSSV
jgi:hypothetical protein